MAYVHAGLPESESDANVLYSAFATLLCRRKGLVPNSRLGWRPKMLCVLPHVLGIKGALMKAQNIEKKQEGAKLGVKCKKQ